MNYFSELSRCLLVSWIDYWSVCLVCLVLSVLSGLSGLSGLSSLSGLSVCLSGLSVCMSISQLYVENFLSLIGDFFGRSPIFVLGSQLRF